MNHILIGFSGLEHPGSTALGLFHTDSGQIRPLLQWPDFATRTIQGGAGVVALATSEEHFFVAVEGLDGESAPSLLVFDRQHFRLLGRDLLTGLGEVRSLLFLDGTLYIVSAGTGEVVAYRADQGRLTGEPFRWRPPSNRPQADRHHLDSLAFFKGELVVSGHRGESHQGFLLSMTRCEPVARSEEIGQPGTLAVVGDSLIYCEEATGTLRRLKDSFSRHLGGWLRGLGVIEDDVFVGSKTEAGCRLYRLHAEDFQERNRYDLPGLPGSITTLLPMDDVSRWPADPDRSWASLPGRPLS